MVNELPLFYAPFNKESDILQLDDNESRHCVRVLRKKAGDRVRIIDGEGNMFLAELADNHKDHTSLRIIKKELTEEPVTASLHIALAPPKNISRFEWFLEKATEIGVQEITPLLCERSERKKIRTDRMQKVIIAAMKQSGQLYKPVLNEMVKTEDFLDHDYRNRFIAYCGTNSEDHLKNAYQTGTDAVICIGPEGDFSEREIENAKRSEFKLVNLGNSRLRTETAGIIACHTVRLMNE